LTHPALHVDQHARAHQIGFLIQEQQRRAGPDLSDPIGEEGELRGGTRRWLPLVAGTGRRTGQDGGHPRRPQDRPPEPLACSLSASWATRLPPIQVTGDRSIGQVSRDLDLTETAVRAWVRQADVDAGQREGLTTEERQELSRLRRENRTLREERDILKRATAFFAKETR
jgi:transposase